MTSNEIGLHLIIYYEVSDSGQKLPVKLANSTESVLWCSIKQGWISHLFQNLIGFLHLGTRAVANSIPMWTLSNPMDLPCLEDFESPLCLAEHGAIISSQIWVNLPDAFPVDLWFFSRLGLWDFPQTVQCWGPRFYLMSALFGSLSFQFLTFASQLRPPFSTLYALISLHL